MENPFKLISSKEVYKNPWIEVREDTVVRPGGKEGIFGVVTMLIGSAVLPLSDDGYIYLTREYAYAYGAESLELPGGAVDEGETPLEAAKRELEEEAGLIAERWTDLGAVHPFTGVVSSANHIFLAEGLEETKQNLDEGEVIHIEKVSFDEALDLVLKGEIVHSASCVAILKVAQMRK